MNSWKVFRVIAGAFFIIIGVLLFVFLRELNDPEVEGDSGRIGLGSYLISLILIIIGVIILFIPKKQ
ncbi:hypothetical protein [Mucilaginibacter gotjawali]|uniref:Uncharacterized protein n=2 Tax=Mucilaginibacter gotjawali TaxID=1550579 RepID=A0A110B138_9SPHI|nr:hypothetical protein [Mucilaginibacter gotjawali]MBB3056644.1 putative membrane protein [Mucilaginibacter gotjawali]BAU52653.1 hypothetical protein MgSA37_00815 [Mucilaginibacter gotjawali]